MELVVGDKMNGTKECGYIAKVKLMDKSTYKKEYEDEGDADKVLLSAMEYLGNKDSTKVYNGVIDYLVKDFEVFDNFLKNLLTRGKIRK